MKYRPEIDGLRAIAVFAVVIYHAEFELNGVDVFKGGFIGVDYSVDWVRNLVKDWHDLALTPMCICPPGSSRRNHRQDQAILTILYYMYQKTYKFNIVDAYFNFSTQNDVDNKHTVNNLPYAAKKLKYMKGLRKYQ